MSSVTHEMDSKRRQLKQLAAKRRELTDTLNNLETQIYNFEASYLQETSDMGNVVKGFDGYDIANSSASSSGLAGQPSGSKRAFAEEDRIFSMSSMTSPVWQHLPDRSMRIPIGTEKHAAPAAAEPQPPLTPSALANAPPTPGQPAPKKPRPGRGEADEKPAKKRAGRRPRRSRIVPN